MKLTTQRTLSEKINLVLPDGHHILGYTMHQLHKLQQHLQMKASLQLFLASNQNRKRTSRLCPLIKTSDSIKNFPFQTSTQYQRNLCHWHLLCIDCISEQTYQPLEHSDYVKRGRKELPYGRLRMLVATKI